MELISIVLRPSSQRFRRVFFGTIAVFFTGGMVLAYLWNHPSPILIESEESKTATLDPVFNQIRWFPGVKQDVWMMRQSHHGWRAEINGWDRLAIVIDKTASPKTARFLQLEPGPLEWKEGKGIQLKAFRVSCFMCHSNGPRAIRPNPFSDQVRLSLMERLEVFAWNLRIKAYGRVIPAAIHEHEDRTVAVPFRFQGKMENQRLEAKTCLRCHQETGMFARGALTRQNSITIQFMVSKGQMPPFGFLLSEKERKEIEDFSKGF